MKECFGVRFIWRYIGSTASAVHWSLCHLPRLRLYDLFLLLGCVWIAAMAEFLEPELPRKLLVTWHDEYYGGPFWCSEEIGMLGQSSSISFLL